MECFPSNQVRRQARRFNVWADCMKIRHANLLNIIGRPAKYGGVTIVPAEVELEGMSFSPSYPLAEIPVDRIPPILRLPIERHYDVAWVRARLPHAFGISPVP